MHKHKTNTKRKEKKKKENFFLGAFCWSFAGDTRNE